MKLDHRLKQNGCEVFYLLEADAVVVDVSREEIILSVAAARI
jgi:hypothetical protein